MEKQSKPFQSKTLRKLNLIFLFAAFLVFMGYFAQDEVTPMFRQAQNIEQQELNASENAGIANKTRDYVPKAKVSALRGGHTEPKEAAEDVALRQGKGYAVAPLPTISEISTPQLKLAIANFPKIFDSYYKTHLADIELAGEDGDKTRQDTKRREVHAKLKAELEQVVLTYSLSHNLDLVLDSGSSSSASGVPVVVYARPGVDDITDDVIALANAGHE